MDPTIWGFHAWKYFFSTVLAYPENPSNQDKLNYKNFFESQRNILPCDHCRENYHEHYQELPIDDYIHQRDNLFVWLLRMNNKVNIKKNKPILAPEDVFTKYFNVENIFIPYVDRRDPRFIDLLIKANRNSLDNPVQVVPIKKKPPTSPCSTSSSALSVMALLTFLIVASKLVN